MWRASLVDTENTTSTLSLTSVVTCRSPGRAQLCERENEPRPGVHTSVGCEAGAGASASARTPRLGGVGTPRLGGVGTPRLGGVGTARLGGVGGGFLADSDFALSFFLPKPHVLFFFGFCFSSSCASVLLVATGAIACAAGTVSGRARGKYST